MPNELKPCPFCGSEKLALSVKGADYPYWYASIYCKACHCYGKRERVTIPNGLWVSRHMIGTSNEIQQIAIEAWNRRAEGGGAE